MAEQLNQFLLAVLPHIQKTITTIPTILNTDITYIFTDPLKAIQDPLKTFPVIVLVWVFLSITWSLVKSIGAWISWLVKTIFYCSLISIALYGYAIHGPTLIKMLNSA
jgi:hypothetical protein